MGRELKTSAIMTALVLASAFLPKQFNGNQEGQRRGSMRIVGSAPT
jgi:hypothetical protein